VRGWQAGGRRGSHILMREEGIDCFRQQEMPEGAACWTLDWFLHSDTREGRKGEQGGSVKTQVLELHKGRVSFSWG